jgi:hypothetical protein
VSAVLVCAADVAPLDQIRAGQRGIGRTVFSGQKIEEFQVEVLGVLENIGPKQSLILARLSGGPLAETGVMQGMSGSPVYIGGKLAGAVAFSFPFSKEPIAGIRPIEEMLRAAPEVPPARASLEKRQILPAIRPAKLGDSGLTEIATPVWFAGFTPGTLEYFAPQLRGLGFEPRQGTSGGGRPPEGMGNSASLAPGAMISVQLLTGDLNAGADGTVTHIDGKRIYGFGHRLLAAGDTELPFARAEVLTLLPAVSSSFKISTAREWMGTITQDRSTAVAGELGQRASLIPISISLNRPVAGRPASGATTYKMEMVNDRFLSPFLMQMAVFSAIDATERTLGLSSFQVRGEIQFQDGTAPVRLDNVYAGDFNVPAQVSLGTAIPLAYVLQNSFPGLKLRNVSLTIDAFDSKKQLQIDQVWTSRATVRPGQSIDLTVVFTGEGGAEVVRKASYTVPLGATTGPLYFTVADGASTNFSEYRQLATTPPRSAAQLVSFLNGLRSNSGAYIRVWRAEPGYQIAGDDLPAPPPSVSMVLTRSHASLGGPPPTRNSKIAEMEIRLGDFAVSGSKTVQVEVKE